MGLLGRRDMNDQDFATAEQEDDTGDNSVNNAEEKPPSKRKAIP